MLTEKEIKMLENLEWSKERIILDFGTEVYIKSVKVPFRHKFWKLWKSNKMELKKLGYSIIKPDLDFHLVHSVNKPRETRSWTDNETRTN